MDMFGIGFAIGIETEWPTSKSIPMPNPVPIPIIPKRSDLFTIYASERNSASCYRYLPWETSGFRLCQFLVDLNKLIHLVGKVGNGLFNRLGRMHIHAGLLQFFQGPLAPAQFEKLQVGIP